MDLYLSSLEDESATDLARCVVVVDVDEPFVSRLESVLETMTAHDFSEVNFDHPLKRIEPKDVLLMERAMPVTRHTLSVELFTSRPRRFRYVNIHSVLRAYREGASAYLAHSREHTHEFARSVGLDPVSQGIRFEPSLDPPGAASPQDIAGVAHLAQTALGHLNEVSPGE